MARLIYTNTKQADMRYAVGMDIPDPFFYLESAGKKYVFLDHREIGPFEEKNTNTDIEAVLSVSLYDEAKKISGQTKLENKLALLIIKKYCNSEEKIEVPNHFPLDMADYLRKEKIALVPMETFFPERSIKKGDEVQHIKQNIQKTIKAFERIEQVLREATIAGDRIMYDGKELTSEFLKLECDRVLLEGAMFNEMNIIISAARHSAMPHHLGTGVLFAHEPIVCDIFPRNRDNAYYADMTRTYVKGNASEQFSRMYAATLKAQEAAFSLLKDGVKTKSVYDAVCQVFVEEGFHVGDVGFVHGVGHSLGLDIHEEPYVNSSYNGTLQTGNVITIEPGLYYAEHGGVRIEDVVLITKDGYENLTNYPKHFVIN